MNILVRVPPAFADERAYIWSVILGDFLGHEVTVLACEQSITTLSVPGSGGQVTVADGLFAMPISQWLTPESLPCRATRLDLAGLGDVERLGFADVVSLFGHADPARPAVQLGQDMAGIDFDLSGAAFFMLSRYEEAVPGPRDAHGRFPSTSMVSVKEGFSDRPVVNEYVELLRACLDHVWPGSGCKEHNYSVALSHDVDSIAFTLGAGVRQLASAVAGDVLHRRDLGLATRRVSSFVARGKRRLEKDPYNTFDFLMDVSERHALRSAFYFIAGGATRYDASYSIDQAFTRALIRKMIDRGHEVGLHPSYGTPTNADAIRSEFAALRAQVTAVGATQDRWGGRQHYLRWSATETWSHWTGVGMDYDSSIGFADLPGFRAGCCFEYPAYDLVQRRRLALLERPLIVMEKTAFGDCTTKAEVRDGLERSTRLADVVKRFGGCFTLLWHNSKIVTRVQKGAYQTLVEAIL